MLPRHRRHRERAIWSVCLVICFGSRAVAAQVTAATPEQSAALRAEIARGAAAISEVTAHNYPYATVHRLIRNRVEKNIQERRDSDGFRLGAHVAAGFWVRHLPEEVSWRKTALARHRDVVYWLLPRVGLPIGEIAGVVAHAEGLSKASQQELLGFLEAIVH